MPNFIQTTLYIEWKSYLLPFHCGEGPHFQLSYVNYNIFFITYRILYQAGFMIQNLRFHGLSYYGNPSTS